jgi:high-affinity iron transporter
VLGSFLIFFREALEASMICSIMLAYLKQVGRRDRFKDVWLGVGAAILLAFLCGVVIFATLRQHDGSNLQSEFEGITYFVACVILTYMSFWMKRQGRSMKKELHAKMDQALVRGSMLAIVLIAFITVGREGLETVVFMLAIAFHTQPLWLAIGALFGTLCGLSLSYVIYVLGKRVNLSSFFTIMGTLLMFLAAGLLADGIEAFSQLGWIPLSQPLWHTGAFLSEDSTFGDILHSFFGYADSPTLLQVGLYLVFLIASLTFYWRSSGRKRSSIVAK